MTSAAAVRLAGVTKRFGPKTAVDGVSLIIESGLAYGLIGPNGAGKTTTFSMMAGFLTPTHGSIEILGFAQTAVDSLRARVGVLPQDALLPPNDRVGDFLVQLALLQDLPRPKAVEAATRALAEVQGSDWWKQRCGSLSHGMAKRVSLAQAFLGEPDVVSSRRTDRGTRSAGRMGDSSVHQGEEGTARPSSYRATTCRSSRRICDGAAILDRGRLVAAGRMADLTAANDEVRVKVGLGTKRGTAQGAVSVQALQELPMVRSVDFDDEELEIVVSFERKQADAETVIGEVLSALLKNHVRISGVTKGRGLEQRVMDLT